MSDYYCVGRRRFLTRESFAPSATTASGLASWCNACGSAGERAPRPQQLAAVLDLERENEYLRDEVAELRRSLAEDS